MRNPIFPTQLRSCLLISTLIAAGILPGCAEEQPEVKPVVRPVKIVTIGSIGAEGQRELPGTIKAAQHAEMSFEVAGRILEFRVKEGQEVEKGAVLARLDEHNYQANLDKASANLRKAEADLERGMNVFRRDPGAIAKTQIDADRRAVEVAEADLRKQQKAMEDTLLRAPFDGRVARRLVEDFQNIQAKEPVLILQNLSHLEIEVSVPERDVVEGNRSRPPDEVASKFKPEVIVTSVRDRSFPARVKEFATTADPVTRTFPVRLIFDNPLDIKILPGMTAMVRYRVRNEGAVKLPANAIFADSQGTSQVWKVDPQSMQVRKVAVELGGLSGKDVAVVGGLNPGDQIAVSGVHQLREGMTVRRYRQTANNNDKKQE